MQTNENNLQKALLAQPAEDKKVRCSLCSHRCLIDQGKSGFCAVRKNIAGTLYSLNYHNVCAANVDPIEKKPLFHFQPGSQSFSIAAIGCNFRCSFCQNWQISQAHLTTAKGQSLSPEQIVAAAKQNNCKSIAYTYTEPTVFMELADQTGRLAKQQNIANVFVSNGYQTREAIDLAARWLDAINIDLKSFSDDFYRKMCKARLAPVLETISYIAAHTDIWLEVTTLVVPNQNDSDQELKQIADFIAKSAGPDTPWHVSRFFPNYDYTDSPPTPLATLQRAYEIGKKAGLRYIYIGNLPHSRAESTFCPNCSELLIKRAGYTIIDNKITDNRCPFCNTQIPGREL